MHSGWWATGVRLMRGQEGSGWPHECRSQAHHTLCTGVCDALHSIGWVLGHGPAAGRTYACSAVCVHHECIMSE